MRPILSALFLAASLAPIAARAESGMCEYRHPAHPSWDFFASCSWSETQADGVTTRQAAVSNGSKFSTVDAVTGSSVNGLTATRANRDDAECWRTEAEDELICVYPAGTISPATPMAEPRAAASDLGGAPAPSFGGGVSGYCLLSEAGALVEQGRCTRRENCVDLDGGSSCLVSYVWTGGRETEVAITADWTTLDGAAAIKGDPGCMVDTGAAITFCWSRTAMTPKSHPVLAPPPVPQEAAASDPAQTGEGEARTDPPAAAD